MEWLLIEGQRITNANEDVKKKKSTLLVEYESAQPTWITALFHQKLEIDLSFDSSFLILHTHLKAMSIVSARYLLCHVV